MNSTDKIAIGQVVKSQSGRDLGRIFLVLDIIDDLNVSIVDGDLRKLKKPKKKKIKHLMVYKDVVSDLKSELDKNNNINDAYIRKLLEPFKKSF